MTPFNFRRWIMIAVMVLSTQYPHSTELVAQELPPGRGVTLGYLTNNFLYSIKEGQTCVTHDQVLLSTFRNGLFESYKDYPIGTLHDPFHMFRWRIQHDILWKQGSHMYSIADRIPIEDFLFVDDKVPEKEKKAFVEKKYPGNRYPDGVDSAWDWNILPIQDRYQQIMEDRDDKGISRETEVTEAYADFLPTAPDHCLCFLSRNQTMEIWKSKKYKFIPIIKNGFGTWSPDWEEKAEIIPNCPFHCSFMVFAQEETYYFVTQTGKLYISEKPKRGKRTIEPLWIESDQPIARMIIDERTNRIFAFTLPQLRRDETKAKQVYFELNPKLDWKEVDAKQIKESKLSYPHNRIHELATFLIDLKVIKPPTEPTPKKK